MPDTLTPTLRIDDKILRDIIGPMYYPQSPYEFSVFPAEILGQVYEQFLGKVIRLTGSHQAKIEEKPEVRKAGGVYYTPSYIVEYIVRETVGKLCEGKTPAQVSKLHILDPSCGSGSFLLGVYSYLLDWHLKWYIQHEPEKHRKQIFKTEGRDWRLTTAEKRRILINNVYGVDIDSQAVEVTKLSLLLKVLEGENKESLQELLFGRVRALPDLGRNIKCGNSLIGSDYFVGQLIPNEDEQRRVNPFDWKIEFPEIMRASGGFDVVLGNPPYVFSRELLTTSDKQYFATHYGTIWEKPNTYMIFMEKALSLISNRGVCSFIVPNSWLTVEAGKKLRDLFSPRLCVLADLLYPVFEGVTVETVIFVARKESHQSKVKCSIVRSLNEFDSSFFETSSDSWKTNDGKICLASDPGIDLVLDKIIRQSERIGDFFDVKTGLQAYEVGKGNPRQTKKDVKDHVFDYDTKYDKNTYRYLDGKDVGRYVLSWNNRWLRYGPWLSQPRTIDIFTRPRILLREITSPLPYCVNGVFTQDNFLNNKSILNILHSEDDSNALLFLLGQLNSKLLSIFYKNKAVKSARTLFPKIVIKDLRTFPYVPVDSRSNDKSVQITQKVKMALDLQNHLKALHAPGEVMRLKRQVASLYQEIDHLVYELYMLTEQEIELVEAYAISMEKADSNETQEQS